MLHRIASVVVLTMLFAFNAAAQLAAQQSSANGVTVAVTPGNLAPGAKTWEFAIVLNTHSQDLSDDLAKSAVLVDDKGNVHNALAWEGAPPGGHHRKGVLTFEAITPRPQAVGLRIARPGESAARTFRWEMK